MALLEDHLEVRTRRAMLADGDAVDVRVAARRMDIEPVEAHCVYMCARVYVYVCGADASGLIKKLSNNN